MASFFDFDNLPEDLQVGICACLAPIVDLAELTRFSTLSTSTYRICYHPLVLRRSSMRLPMYPWHAYPSSRYPDFIMSYDNYVLRCSNAGNPLAIFWVGLSQYFDPESDEEGKAEGLNHIARAAEEGLEEARKVYGLILICLGGENRQKGYRIMSPFSIPLTPSNVIEMETYWSSRRNSFVWSGREMMESLKRNYVRDDCSSCDGLTSEFFAKFWPGWSRFERFEGWDAMPACEVCLWHEVCQVFFDYF